MDAYFANLFGVHPQDKLAWKEIFATKEGISLCTELEMQKAAEL